MTMLEIPRAIFDTNVVVNMILGTDTLDNYFLGLVMEGEIVSLTTRALMSEQRRVFSRPTLGVAEEELPVTDSHRKVLENFIAKSVPVMINQSSQTLKSLDLSSVDQNIAETAIWARCFIVTEDDDFATCQNSIEKRGATVMNTLQYFWYLSRLTSAGSQLSTIRAAFR